MIIAHILTVTQDGKSCEPYCSNCVHDVDSDFLFNLNLRLHECGAMLERHFEPSPVSAFFNPDSLAYCGRCACPVFSEQLVCHRCNSVLHTIEGARYSARNPAPSEEVPA